MNNEQNVTMIEDEQPRLTEYHCGIAVIRGRKFSDAAKKLAAYEDLGFTPEEIQFMLQTK